MIGRYSPADMAALFSDEARFARWLEVELLAVDAHAAIGAIPAADAAAVRERAPTVGAAFVEAVAARERVTDHDVAAFVDVVQTRIGGREAAWVHYGLTSSDVVDTAQCATLTRAADILVAAATDLVTALRARAEELIDVPVAGRTHGMQAEPTTFGAKFALWALQVGRDRERLRRARRAVAVGTYSNLDPAVEAFVCRALGLEPVPATQVIARDRHAEYLYACASVGATVELIATEVRHLARSEVGEAEEPFGAGQKGSSAMPHKRNPVLSERLCGLARLLRGYAVAGLEDVALWHERDISHSSVERVALPDASMLACYVLRKATGLVAGLVVHPERALANQRDLVFSQSVLLALVDGGMARDDAYRIVQRDARRAWEEGRTLRSVLEDDEEVPLDPAAIGAAFDLGRVLRHRHRFLDALGSLDEPRGAEATPTPGPASSAGGVPTAEAPSAADPPSAAGAGGHADRVGAAIAADVAGRVDAMAADVARRTEKLAADVGHRTDQLTADLDHHADQLATDLDHRADQLAADVAPEGNRQP